MLYLPSMAHYTPAAKEGAFEVRSREGRSSRGWSQLYQLCELEACIHTPYAQVPSYHRAPSRVLWHWPIGRSSLAVDILQVAMK